jgi:predicted nucleic acid-binding Zn ribbon protein
MTNEPRLTCIICEKSLEPPPLNLLKRSRRARSDRVTCSARCRKRRSRRRATALALISQISSELQRGKP